MIAGPGSGKTTVLVSRICYLAETCGVDPSRILVLTFTRAASMLMRRRSFEIYEGSDAVTFSTFHALFLRILTDLRVRYRIIDQNDRLRFLRLKAEDYFPTPSLRPDPEDISVWITGRLAAERTGGDGGRAEPADRDELVFERILADYRAYLRDNSLVDLDETALLCDRLLERDPAAMDKWGRRWDYILVDEFQDINLPQYTLVKRLSSGTGNLYVVGDDDQSIYGFRGSSPLFMRRFLLDHPKARRIFLTDNYRSTPGIVAASAAVIDVSRLRIPKRLHSAGCEPMRLKAAVKQYKDVRVLPAPDEAGQTELVLQTVRKALESGSCASAALITRTHRQLRRWEHALEGAGIPFKAGEGARDRTESLRGEILEDLAAYDRAAREIDAGLPREILLRILNRPDRGLGREVVPDRTCSRRSLLACCRGRRGTERAVRALLADLDTLRGLPPDFFIRYLCGPCGYAGPVGSQDRASREQFLVLKSRLLAAARKTGCRDMSLFLEEFRSQEETEKETEGQETDAVLELCTMHACKGREFDLVLLPDLNEGILPSRRSMEPETLEEERRLLYVALTRACRSLVLFYMKGSRTNPRMPSRFLRPLGISGEGARRAK